MKVPTGFDDYLEVMVTCYSRKTPKISPVQKVFDVLFNRKYTDFEKEVQKVFEAAEMSFDRTMQIDVPNCKEVFKWFKTYHRPELYLMLASKVSGIYNCTRNCTLSTSSDIQFLLRYIQSRLNTISCGYKLKDECENALNRINNLNTFTALPYQQQATDLAIVVKSAIGEMEQHYHEKFATDKIIFCVNQIKYKCLGMKM